VTPELTLAVDENGLRGSEIATGPGSDCETCGWSPDQLEVEEYEPGRWSVVERFGCIGGNAAYGLTAVEAAARIRAVTIFGDAYASRREDLALAVEIAG
jgi:hypothetical protein